MIFIEEICKITDQVKENAKEREERIIQYIKEHYKDINLNVATVADQFELNASYLSRLFKEQTGENLLSYINKYRVEQAKKLLEGTTKTLIKVAEETGFLNTAALTRAFKKYEGVTPGQYKEIYGNKK
jgi:two-component system response regulator YesN